MNEDGAVIDRMFGALARGDVHDALDCLAQDALVWHSFDRIACDKAEMQKQWQALVDDFPERAFVDVRRQPIAGGFVQQFVMAVTTGSGARMAWPICSLIRIDQGLIVRIDEYIDRAGPFDPPADGPIVTPGL
jgi:ketosteroid isomerase-like protein